MYGFSGMYGISCMDLSMLPSPSIYSTHVQCYSIPWCCEVQCNQVWHSVGPSAWFTEAERVSWAGPPVPPLLQWLWLLCVAPPMCCYWNDNMLPLPSLHAHLVPCIKTMSFANRQTRKVVVIVVVFKQASLLLLLIKDIAFGCLYVMLFLA